MTISINTLTNNSTFGEWKDITNAMGDGFDSVLTFGSNAGSLALTGNISAGGTLTVGTITYGTVAGGLINIERKTNIAQTLKILNDNAVAKLSFAQNDATDDDWSVETDSTHNELKIEKTVGVTTKSFTFNYSSGSITASGFTFGPLLLPNINGEKISDDSIDSRHYVDTSIDTEHLNIGGTAGTTKFLRCSDADGTTMEWDTPPSTVYTAGNGITLTNTSFSLSDQNAKLELAGGTITGPVIFNDSQKLSFGTSGTADSAFYYAGTSNILRTDLGTNCSKWQIRDDTTTIFTFNDTGSFVATDDITAFSDRTLKENIISIPNALDKVCAIGGYTYDRTDIVRDRQTGVIAQEVLEVLPEAVHQNEDGIYSVAYGNMVGLLVEAIKELKSEVDELRSNA